MSDLIAVLREAIGDKAWSSLKGAIIATLGVIITQLVARYFPDSGISPDISNVLAAAIVTTILNAAKQYLLPSKK